MVCRTSELVFVDRPQLPVGTNNLKTTDKQKYKLLPWADGPYRIISVQQHTMTMNENVVLNAMSIDRATLASSNNSNANVGDGRNAIKGERAIIENEYQALEGDVGKNNWCDTLDTMTHLTPAAIKNMDGKKAGQFEDPDVNDDVVDVREFAVEQSVGQTQRNGRTHHVVRWYGFTCKDDTVEPLQNVLYHRIGRNWRLIGKRRRAANAQTNKYRSNRCQ